MVRLRSRQANPVGGFQFIDAPISDEVIQSWDFRGICNVIQARRQANPRFGLATDLPSIGAEVDYQNALRMMSIPGADSYIIKEEGPPPANFPRPRSPSAGVAGAVKQISTGAAVLFDWFGAGGMPVAGDVAEKRAGICATCPQNEKGDWLSWFTKPAQELIRRQLSVRKDLDFSTTHDKELEACAACACPLKLKVHVPLKHITDHLSDETRGKLDSRCWILNEK